MPPRLLVTGANGRLGTKVVDHLLTLVPAAEIAVSVRAPDAARHHAARGIEVRHGDFDDPATLDTAFAGIERLLMISSGSLVDATRLDQHANAIDAAGRAGIGFLAYTSMPRADTSPMDIAAVHRPTEAMVRAAGMHWSFLRNNWYVENAFEEVEVVPWVLDGRSVVTACRDGRIGWVLRDDLARAAAIVLAGDERHDDTVYELSGPPVSYDAFAAALGEATGRPVEVEHVDDDAFRRALVERGTDPVSVDIEVPFQAEVRRGDLDVESSDLATLLGAPPTPLAEALRIAIADRAAA